MADYDLGTARGRIEIDGSGAVDGVNDAQNAVGGLNSKLNEAGSTLTRTGAIAGGAGLAIFAGFGLAVKSAADFEQVMNGIAAVTGATGQEMDSLREKALQLGKDTVFSAGEAAAAIEELAKAGISTDDILNGAADAAVNLAAAGGIQIPEAATIAANAMNAFQLSAQDLPHVVDMIAGAANASAIDVTEFSQSMTQAAAVAHINGIAFDDLAVSIAAMGNAGIKGSDAGTSLKTFLQNLQPTTEKDAQLMRDLGLITDETGNQFIDASGKIKPMREIFDILQDKLSGLSDAERAHTLAMLFGTDAVRASAIATQLGAEGYDKLNESIQNVSAADVAAKRMEGLNGAIEQLKGSFETFLIIVGTPLLKSVANVLTVFTEFLNKILELPSPVRNSILALLGVVGALLVLAGGAAIFLGTIAKIIFAFKRFQEAMAIVKQVKAFQQTMQLLNLTFLANPVFLLIAALVALGVIFYLLYTRSETFRRGIQKIGEFAEKVGKQILEAFKVAWEWIKENWDILLTILTGPFGAVILIVRRWGDDIVKAVKKVIDWIKDNWDIILAVLTGPFGLVILFIRRWGDDFIELIKNVVDSVIKFFRELPGKIVAFLRQIVSDVANFVADLIAQFVSLQTRGLAIIVGWVTGMASTILGFIANIIGAFFGFVGTIVGLLFSLAGQAIGAVTGMMSSMIGAISNGIGQIIGFFAGLPGRILGALGDVGNLLYEAGKSIVQGLINGVKSLAGAAVDAVKSIPGKALGAVKGIIGFGSPAKEFIKIGESIPEGLAVGVLKAEQQAVDAVSAVAKSMLTFPDTKGIATALSHTAPQSALAVAQGAGMLRGSGTGAQAGAAGGMGAGVQVVINNPVPEAAEDSMSRQMSKLAYLGVLEGA